jgi:SET domain-containing protein
MNYTSPRVEARQTDHKGWGLYAIAPIAAGETVVAFGGNVVDGAELRTLAPHRRAHSIQIDEDLFMVGPEESEPGDYVNHSCDPTTGILGNCVLVALRDIDPDEEITFDYAMSDSTAYDEFECQCGTRDCRGHVTGNDWMRVELQDRYAGWFSAYLARKIAALESVGPQRRAFAVA